jgi:hypothetical protein
MDIENQKITVRVNNFNEKHFISLGYDVPRNTYIEIFVRELPIGSGLKIDVECNYCGKIFKKSYRRYLETKENLCCNECKYEKMMQTDFMKYGHFCSLRNEEVNEKTKKTNLERYGFECVLKNKEIKEKAVKTFKKNGGTHGNFISKPQIYLTNLFLGELDCIEFPYRLDAFFENENIYFEYDGSGHNMLVKLGKITEQEFEIKEIERSLFLKEKGYKEFRIISNNDIFPKDEELIKIKERAFDLLLNKNYQKYIYNLNTKTESFEE